MTNLATRIITGIIAVAIVIPAIIYSYLGIWLLCVVVSMAALWEFFNLTPARATHYRLVGFAMGAIIWITALLELLLPELQISRTTYWVEATLILPLLQIATLFDPKEARPIEQIGGITLGFLYVILPLFLLFDLSIPGGAPESYDWKLPLGFLLLTWAVDVSAYFAGRFIGGKKLFERISPKKTWSGAIGGGIFCLFWGWVNTQLFPTEAYNWIIIAAIVAVFSQMGDLVESMFKRSAKVKDSGGLLPGHGGMLDRFDGTFLSLPFIYLYFSLL